jgi:phosphoenolpyruvate-protein kinase (PTS system EI component)
MGTPLHGVSASPGIVVGTAQILRWEVPEVPVRVIPDEAVPAELARLHTAIGAAVDRLQQCKARAQQNAGPAEAAIFDVQVAVLGDEALTAGRRRRWSSSSSNGASASRGPRIP